MLKRLVNVLRSTARTVLAVVENDDTFRKASRAWRGWFRNRADFDRQSLLENAINAWRSNPIAKRIIEITTEFVVGDGFGFKTSNKRLGNFIKATWNHPLNDFDNQISEWADETWRSGDLFLIGSVDASGRTFWRAVPAEMIGEIITKENDYRQELAYKTSQVSDVLFKPYDSGKVYGRKVKGQKLETSFMLHFPLNRAVGATFGESDLYSVLYWIGLYTQWLEDRARLNYFRSLFAWFLKKRFANGDEKKAYAKEIEGTQPTPGSVMIVDPDEEWEAKAPNLASGDASEDGLNIKRMIATGVQMPMHYLAEPEGSTRTTANAAGTPTFKRFKRRQKFLAAVVYRVLQVTIEIRRTFESGLPKAEFEITTPDIAQQDNAQLALAVQRVVSAFIPLYNAKKINTQELMRLVYRFLDETAPDNIDNTFIPIDVGSGSSNPVAPPTPPTEPDPTEQPDQPAD